MNLERAVMKSNIVIFSFTENGAKLSLKLRDLFKDVELYSKYCIDDSFKSMNDSIYNLTGSLYYKSRALIFISAAGIAVRAVSQYIKTKDKDPAVIVIDEGGRFVIPLLSGHLGGANEIAQEIAEYISATAVITTATDINNKFAVDVWAKNNNLYITDKNMIKEVSSRVLRGEKTGFISDYNISGIVPEYLSSDENCDCGIVISDDENKKPYKYTMNLIPKEYVLGIGARRGAEFINLKNFIEQIFLENNLDMRKILAISSIDLKKDEQAIIELSHYLGVSFVTYTKEELEKIEGEFTQSAFVQKVTGVDNVCERSASMYGGDIIIKKVSSNGFTLSVSKKKWEGSF